MNRYKATQLLLLLVSIAFVACKNADIESEAKALLETDNAFAAKSVATSASEAFFQFMTEDALQLPAGAFPVTGRAAIRDSMQADFDYELSWFPQYAEVAESGDLGYTWGYYHFKIAGDETVRHGKYLNVWKKQEDGSWKVAVDMGNSNPKPELPEN